MATAKAGHVVKAQERVREPHPLGIPRPRVRVVSQRFMVRAAAVQFAAMYEKAHPQERVWIE